MKEEKFYDIINGSMLFKGVGDRSDVEALLSCLNTERVLYKKGEYIILAGDELKFVGFVLSGQLSVFKDDLDGERSIITQITAGEIFAEALCCSEIEYSPVSVFSETDSEVLLLDFNRVLKVCGKTCAHHSRLIENVMMILAKKNIHLQERMEYLSKKTIRKKIMKYLWRMSDRAKNAGGFFSIPYSREELADYLSVDRSALSRELSKLKAEGEIDFWKNQFKILKISPDER